MRKLKNSYILLVCSNPVKYRALVASRMAYSTAKYSVMGNTKHSRVTDQTQTRQILSLVKGCRRKLTERSVDRYIDALFIEGSRRGLFCVLPKVITNERENAGQSSSAGRGS